MSYSKRSKENFPLLYGMQILVLLLFCAGMLLYALGLASLSKVLQTQSFFHIGGLLFVLAFWKKFSKQDLKFLRIPFLCFAVVICLGLLTYFNPIMPRTFSEVFRSVNTHILGYFILFTLSFLFAFYVQRALVAVFFGFIALLCIIEIVQTINITQETQGFRRVPFYFKEVFTYNLWLLLPSAVCISGAFVFKNWWVRILFLSGLYPCLEAMLANGERSFLVALVGMFIAPFIFYTYRFKIFVLATLFVAMGVGGIFGYHYSKNLPDRYNFAHMIDNFSEVWNTQPSEMGKYDAWCFSGLKCTNESTKDGIASFTWEHSSLARIAMTKSTLLAVLDNPLKPHIVGVFEIGQYLRHYYELKNPENRVYMSISGDSFNGYNAPHNFIISLILSYGILGFLAIVVFVGLLFKKIRDFSTTSRYALDRLIGLSCCVLLCGISVQCLFDSIYGVILQPFFVVIGLVYGYSMRYRNGPLSNL